jgi:hypothetical protein
MTGPFCKFFFSCSNDFILQKVYLSWYVHSCIGLIMFFFKYFFFWGGDFLIFSYFIQHCFICRPSDSTVPTDAGIEPRTDATGALTVRRSVH